MIGFNFRDHDVFIVRHKHLLPSSEPWFQSSGPTARNRCHATVKDSQNRVCESVNNITYQFNEPVSTLHVFSSSELKPGAGRTLGPLILQNCMALPLCLQLLLSWHKQCLIA